MDGMVRGASVVIFGTDWIEIAAVTKASSPYRPFFVRHATVLLRTTPFHRQPTRISQQSRYVF